MNRSITSVIINLAASLLSENFPLHLAPAASHFGIEFASFVAPGNSHNSGKDFWKSDVSPAFV